jgi:chorismate synthase
MLRYLTAGESHGPALSAMIEGMPAGVPLTDKDINVQLARRQVGYGRGARMAMEKDTARVLSGIRFGKTLGSPISLVIENRDWENWTTRMMQFEHPDEEILPVTLPRPGHADLSGMSKYRTHDLRNILERSSARETAARVALGAIARQLLTQLGVKIFSHVLMIGGIAANVDYSDLDALAAAAEANEVRCADPEATAKIHAIIKQAKKDGDTIGGVSQVIVTGLPIGLGSYVQWDRRLDGKLAGALMAINAIKGVEVGMGFGVSKVPGSQVHDAMYRCGDTLCRKTNNAGGIEGGMTNGEPVMLQIAMKPIPTLVTPLGSVDVLTGEEKPAHSERSDVCAVPASGVVAEAMVSLVLANEIIDQFNADTLEGLQAALKNHNENSKKMLHWGE